MSGGWARGCAYELIRKSNCLDVASLTVLCVAAVLADVSVLVNESISHSVSPLASEIASQ